MLLIMFFVALAIVLCISTLYYLESKEGFKKNSNSKSCVFSSSILVSIFVCFNVSHTFLLIFFT